MSYHSIAEILESASRSEAEFAGRVADLSQAQAEHRPAGDRWTIAEIVEHVSIVNDGFLRITHKLLKQAETDGIPAPPGLNIGPTWSGSERMQAPERVRPQGGVPIAESLARIERTLAGLHELRPRLEAVDLSRVTFPHPAFGETNLYQWLVLLGEHQDRHRRQIEAILTEIEHS